MSVIIRLQNLPWSANALDIRQYFHGLSIPEGGVHIVGGELGDAFIAFSTDEDARLAFERNNGKLKEVQIKLMLSSRTEMQRVIEAARSQTMPYLAPVSTPVLTVVPSPVPLQPIVSQIPSASKRDDNDVDSDKERTNRRDRKRSRSWSQDRSEKSRDRDKRDRRRRDRSRSRSRDRRERRHRDRSWSRDRHRSKDSDKKINKDRRRSDDKNNSPNNNHKEIKPWEHKSPSEPTPPSISGSVTPHCNSDLIRRSINLPNTSNVPMNINNYTDSFGRDNWPSNTPFPRVGFSGSIDRFNNGNQKQNNFNNTFGENGNRFNRKWQNDSPKQFHGRSDFRDRIRNLNNENCCVRLHPYYGGFGEIRRFFHGLFIHNSGIKLLNDKYGKRTGWVYVRFVYPDGKDQALQRSGDCIRKQSVEILHLDDDEFEREIDRYRPTAEFIENIEIEDDDDDDDDVVEIDPSSSNFRPKPVSRQFNELNVAQKTVQNYTCLIVEDLPTYAKEQDLLKMFSDYSLMSIIIVENRKQRKNQIAYVKFSNPEHAKKACEETIRHSLDGKLVNVRPCDDEEFQLINKQQNDLMGADGSQEINHVPKVESECIRLSGLPLSVTDRDITDFFCDVGIVPDKIHLITDVAGFTGEAFCEFISLDEAQSAVGKNGMYLGSGVVSVKSVSRRELEESVGLGSSVEESSNQINNNSNLFSSNPRPYFRNNFNMSPRGFGFMGPRSMRFYPPIKSDTVGPPGCTVLMGNVPYKASLDEILDFFKAFDVQADNVLRRFNSNGNPSGEAKVIFNNPELAHKALQSRNREKIRDRVVYLSLC